MGCVSAKRPRNYRDVPNELSRNILAAVKIRNVLGALANEKKLRKGVITEELNRLYDYFDKDGDGYITKSEILAVLKNTHIYVTEGEASDILKRFDTDGDGCLGRAEFQKMLAGYIKRRKQNLVRLFEHFDLDSDGYLSYSEFKRAMFFLGECVTVSDVREMMDKHYKNPTNKINFKQFCIMVHTFV